ncbi:serine/threonine-protein kinase 19 [Tetranychus urticae]|uniref:Serine/threonine-protein kinase 19 n=1 Tax=Tetranychus urticae TaxID=32264 RepID=T1JYR9_TETUR|nr:serine/threonine-protein kinase 19 [Tetranychus urticae]
MSFNKRKNEDQEESNKRICQVLDTKLVDVKSALDHVKDLFSNKLFGEKFPAVIWKHQCYPLIKNRTKVDIELNKFCDQGLLLSLKLGTTINNTDTALIYTEDYINYLKSIYVGNVLDKFIDKVVKSNPSSTCTSAQLREEYQFSDDQIKELVHNGVLAVHRTVGSWLLSLPNCGHFYKIFTAGRNALLSMIKRTKYHEINRTELFNRKMPKDVQLGIAYHVLDLIGGDFVQCADFPNGTMLRVL